VSSVNQNQNILFVAPSAYPLGGVAVWLSYVLNGLASKQNLTVKLGLLSGEFHQSKNYLDQHSIDPLLVNIVEIKTPSGTREGRVRAIESTIKQVNADIAISVNAPDVFEACSRLKQQWKSELKSVMTLHGLEPDYFVDIKTYGSQVDSVITTNRLTQKMVVEWSNFEKDRVLYAPYGVEIDEVATENPKSFDPQKPITLLYAGRIESEQKRIQDLISLVDKLEAKQFSYRLKIAGDGPETDSVIAKLNESIQYGSFEYLGNLSQKELFEQAYGESDVLVLFSQWETGPIVIWEAMAHQLAIVTSQYIGSKTEAALEHNDNALIFPIADVDEAVKQLSRLTNEKGLYESLIKAGVHCVNERYSRSQSIENWAVALRSVTELTTKQASLMSTQWQKTGRLERIFGHSIGHSLRSILNMPAYKVSAGDEWPHSLSRASSIESQQFNDALNLMEIE